MQAPTQKTKIIGGGNQKFDLLHLDFQSFLKKKIWDIALVFPNNFIGKILYKDVYLFSSVARGVCAMGHLHPPNLNC